MKKGVLTCPGCHCIFFVQKETRKTGVVVIDGKIERRAFLNLPPVLTLVCIRCGCVIPKQQSEKFAFKSQFRNDNLN